MHTQALRVSLTRGRCPRQPIASLRFSVYLICARISSRNIIQTFESQVSCPDLLFRYPAVPHARRASGVTAFCTLSSCTRPKFAFEAEGLLEAFTPMRHPPMRLSVMRRLLKFSAYNGNVERLPTPSASKVLPCPELPRIDHPPELFFT